MFYHWLFEIFDIGVGDFAGPTIVSKVVSESSATSSDTIPIKTSNKEITGYIFFNVRLTKKIKKFSFFFRFIDSTNSSGLNLIGG